MSDLSSMFRRTLGDRARDIEVSRGERPSEDAIRSRKVMSEAEGIAFSLGLVPKLNSLDSAIRSMRQLLNIAEINQTANPDFNQEELIPQANEIANNLNSLISDIYEEVIGKVPDATVLGPLLGRLRQASSDLKTVTRNLSLNLGLTFGGIFLAPYQTLDTLIKTLTRGDPLTMAAIEEPDEAPPEGMDPEEDVYGL